MKRTIGKMTMLALGFCGFTALSGISCSQRGSGADIVQNARTGSATIALQVAGGLTLNTVTYSISGPTAKSGSIDVSHSATISTVIGGLAAGGGYSITLMGTATDGVSSCLGTGTFTVTAGAVTAVTVTLDCHAAPTSGSISVNGVTNTCPNIDGITANPAEVLVGGSIALSAAAHDADSGPSPLSYQWQATGGTLSSATAQNPTFTCATPGAGSVTVTVTDGDSACTPSMTVPVTCTGGIAGVVASSLLVPGSATDPTVQGGYYQGAKVCSDLNDNGKCESGEPSTTTDGSGHFVLATTSSAPVIADIGTTAVNTANGSTNPSRNVFRTAASQISDQGGLNVVISSASTEVVRQMEANGTLYAAEKANLATRLGVAAGNVLADPNGIVGPDKTAVLREEVVLAGRFSYAITKLDRGDLYPDALAVPGGDPELTGLAGVTPATATTPDTRTPITYKQAEQAAFNVEGIPRYDHIFIVMLENKSTQALLGSAYAPNLNAYLQANNFVASYYATGNPSEPNYTALGGGDDFGIVDDSQWNCAATGANAPQDTPLPTKTQPGLGSSPFSDPPTGCTTGGANHNIVNKPNLFNAITAAGMSWRTYSESMNPGQDFRTDSVADTAVTALDNVYAPGTLGTTNNASQVGTTGLVLPLPAGLYKTKHHPGMAYQNVRSAPEFKYSNRTLGGGQWDTALLASSTAYGIPAGYNTDQFGSDLTSGNVGQLNFVIPDQCDDMHGITVKGTVPPSSTQVTASDCSSVNNNVPVGTGGNILYRGDVYTDKLVKKIKASPLWMNQQKKVAIVLMFDEGNATTGLNSCCGWKAGKTAADAPLVQSGSTFVQDTSVAQYGVGNEGHGRSFFIVINNQPAAPKGIKDTDAYSHFSFVRTLQDMFLLSDPTKDGSYMNRSKYTEKFIAQNILNLPEFAASADTHFDAVRPMNHAYVIPAGYVQKQTGGLTDDDTQTAQVGPDATQTNVWSIK
jgi:hypothetical protein